MKQLRALPVSVLLLALLLGGCTLEQKLARQYVKLPRPAPMLVLRPAAVLKYNLKEYQVPDIESLDPLEKDELLIQNSAFLKHIDDSLLTGLFCRKFKETLEYSGWTVLPEQVLDSLMLAGGEAVIVNLAQFTLEEYIHPFTAEEQVYDEIIVIDGIDLNALNFNLWIELSRMNGEQKNQLLFNSDYLLDDINGTLKQNLISGQYGFDYTIDTMELRDIYAFAQRFGEKTAEKLFDHLLNEYIWDNLTDDYPHAVYYYHYDRVRRLVYAIDPGEALLPVKP